MYVEARKSRNWNTEELKSDCKEKFTEDVDQCLETEFGVQVETQYRVDGNA